MEARGQEAGRSVSRKQWNRLLEIDARSSQVEPRGVPNLPRRLLGALKFAFGSTCSSKLGCHGPFGQPLGHSEGPSWRSWASSWSSRESFWRLGGLFWVPRASILRVLARPMASFFGFGIDFAENMKTIEKPRFYYGFSMISEVRKASKSMTNLKKSSPECLETLKNRLRWTGLAGLAAQVANVGPMGAQWRAQ